MPPKSDKPLVFFAARKNPHDRATVH